MFRHPTALPGLSPLIFCIAFVGCGDDSSDPTPANCDQTPDAAMSFFLTEQGNRSAGGNLGGLAGADAICTAAAEAAGITGKTWVAYLSAENDASFGRIDAKDRVGNGPWFNAAGTQVGDQASIHSSGIAKENILTQCGRRVIVNINDLANDATAHDIFTGSTPEGTLERVVDPNSGVREGAAATCADWTSSADTDKALVGHSDWNGPDDFWNWAHDTEGCSLSALYQTGANGRIYCFATSD